MLLPTTRSKEWLVGCKTSQGKELAGANRVHFVFQIRQRKSLTGISVVRRDSSPNQSGSGSRRGRDGLGSRCGFRHANLAQGVSSTCQFGVHRTPCLLGLPGFGLKGSREDPCGDAMGPLSPEAGSTGYVSMSRSAGADRFLGRGRPVADDSRDYTVGRCKAG